MQILRTIETIVLWVPALVIVVAMFKIILDGIEDAS